MKHIPQRKNNKANWTWWQRIALALFLPLFYLIVWYGLVYLSYRLQLYIGDYFQQYSPYSYAILSNLLYTSLSLPLALALWHWGQLLFQYRLSFPSWKYSLIFWACFFSITGYLSYQTYQKTLIIPQVISHRALDGQNAIENSLEALEATSKTQPDLIEIDIYETKDEEFLVFHNPVIPLANKKAIAPHDLALKEATAIPLKDNQLGFESRIPSFDAFLDAAEKKKQRLLIDIKTSPKDSPNMAENFVKKYQDRLVRHGHQVQSADKDFIQQLVDLQPKFDTLLITKTPLEDAIPTISGYSIPLDSLTYELNLYLKELEGLIYVWTVNQEEGIISAEYLEVDAIITDIPSQTRDTLKK